MQGGVVRQGGGVRQGEKWVNGRCLKVRHDLRRRSSSEYWNAKDPCILTGMEGCRAGRSCERERGKRRG